MKRATKSEAPLDIGTQALVDDLMTKPQSFDRDEIIRRAKRFRYHDYKSDDAMCSVTLIKHLARAGFRDLAENAMADKYAQKADARLEYEQTPEGKEAIRITSLPGMEQKMNEALGAMAKARVPTLDEVLAMRTPEAPKGGH